MTNNAIKASLSFMSEDMTKRTELRKQINAEYLTTKRDNFLRDSLKSLVMNTMAESGEDDHVEGNLLIVIGDAGAGKTRAIKEAIREIPGLSDGPLLIAVAPSPCTLKQLGRNLLHEMGYKVKRDSAEHIIWEMVRAQIKASGKRFIWIDEMHHAINAKGAVELEKISETLKNLAQQRDWPVGLILSGKSKLADFIKRDEQIERRSTMVELAPLTFPKHAEHLKNAVEIIIQKHANMSTNGIITDEFANRLCAAARGNYGTIIKMTRLAVFQALDRKDYDGNILIDDYAAVYASKRGGPPSTNIFLADNWDKLTPYSLDADK